MSYCCAAKTLFGFNKLYCKYFFCLFVFFFLKIWQSWVDCLFSAEIGVLYLLVLHADGGTALLKTGCDVMELYVGTVRGRL